MTLRPKPLRSHHSALDVARAAEPLPSAPQWLRQAAADTESLAGQPVADVAFIAGAAFCALDAAVRRQDRCAGVWRQRLALAAAAATVKRAGRIEDEAELRDAVLLTRPGDDVGPAGKMLLAWQRLVSRPADQLLTGTSLTALLGEFGYNPDEEAVEDLAGDLSDLGSGISLVDMICGAYAVAEKFDYNSAVGAWFADALTAQRLGWSRAVPLLSAASGFGGPATRRQSGREERAFSHAKPERTVLAARAQAALRAIDLSAELGRRADRLMAIAPKLRAKASDLVVDRLLSDDALVASEEIAGISDRGLRRLFDRLVEFGAVRELSGRPTFRIYGL